MHSLNNYTIATCINTYNHIVHVQEPFGSLPASIFVCVMPEDTVHKSCSNFVKSYMYNDVYMYMCMHIHMYIYIWDSFRENGPSFIIIKLYKITLHLNCNNFRMVKAINFLLPLLLCLKWILLHVHVHITYVHTI